MVFSLAISIAYLSVITEAGFFNDYDLIGSSGSSGSNLQTTSVFGGNSPQWSQYDHRDDRFEPGEMSAAAGFNFFSRGR